jgi:DNA-directed RNA polymerase specialized sigma24 family protein
MIRVYNVGNLSLGGDMANQYTSIFSFRSQEERKAIENIVKDSLAENRIATRARMLLLRAEGKRQIEVGKILRVHRNTVRLWEKRYREKGIDGLKDKPGRGRQPVFSP